MTRPWIITGEKCKQSVTPDWRSVATQAIDGVVVREVAHVPLDHGHVTELVRVEWLGDNREIAQVFQRTLTPGAVSAWHAHAVTTDRIFCANGQILLVLYDGRADSPTLRALAEYRIGVFRPTLVIIPPGVWHGVKNIGTDPAMLINMVDIAYQYENPDHWTLPADAGAVPYRF